MQKLLAKADGLLCRLVVYLNFSSKRQPNKERGLVRKQLGISFELR